VGGQRIQQTEEELERGWVSRASARQDLGDGFLLGDDDQVLEVGSRVRSRSASCQSRQSPGLERITITQAFLLAVSWQCVVFARLPAATAEIDPRHHWVKRRDLQLKRAQAR
jgi:hypothetical protein